MIELNWQLTDVVDDGDRILFLYSSPTVDEYSFSTTKSHTRSVEFSELIHIGVSNYSTEESSVEFEESLQLKFNEIIGE